jgi:hypothetical protein
VLEQEAGKHQVYEKSVEDSCHLGFASIWLVQRALTSSR